MAEVAILIVEDDRHTCEQICKLLEELFPELRIDFARSVVEAQVLLNRAREEGTIYAIFVLDFKLPLRPGDNPEFALQLRDEVYAIGGPDAFVVHISSYLDDPRIQEYLRQPLSRIDAPRPVCISKLDDPNWANQLTKVVGQIVRGRPILRLLDDLFPQIGSPINHGANNRWNECGELEELRRKIEEDWDYLGEGLQARVRSIFAVSEYPGITVNYF